MCSGPICTLSQNGYGDKHSWRLLYYARIALGWGTAAIPNIGARQSRPSLGLTQPPFARSVASGELSELGDQRQRNARGRGPPRRGSGPLAFMLRQIHAAAPDAQQKAASVIMWCLWWWGCGCWRYWLFWRVCWSLWRWWGWRFFLVVDVGSGGGLGVGSVGFGALRPTPSLELASWADAHEKCKNELDDQT